MNYKTIAEIENVVNLGLEYVYVSIQVFNAGVTVELIPTEDLKYFEVALGQEWNGYDYVMTLDEFMVKMEKVGVFTYDDFGVATYSKGL